MPVSRPEWMPTDDAGLNDKYQQFAAKFTGVGRHVDAAGGDRQHSADLTITGQVSTDLTAWSGAGVTETILTDDGTTQSVRIIAPAAGLRQFLRLHLQER